MTSMFLIRDSFYRPICECVDCSDVMHRAGITFDQLCQAINGKTVNGYNVEFSESFLIKMIIGEILRCEGPMEDDIHKLCSYLCVSPNRVYNVIRKYKDRAAKMLGSYREVLAA